MARKSAVHDPGGKVRLAVYAGAVSTAKFGGESNQYRYTLKRVWDATKPMILFVMMNPSTADVDVDDPTVAKCGRLARKWGYGGLYVGNTFAYRATEQKRLLEVDDPVGPENDRYLLKMAKDSEVVIFAYGTPVDKRLRPRGEQVAKLLREKAGVKPQVLRLSKQGVPWHPLYLPESVLPVEWTI